MFNNVAKMLGVDREESNYYLFMDDVTQESCRSCIEWILSCNFQEERPKQLTLLICSQGGDLLSCFALIDIIRGSSIPIATIGIGGVASAGTFLLMSGHAGMRFLTPNTSVMSHQFAGGSVGKEHELFAIVKEFNLTSERIINHYKKCTGLSEKDIRKKLLPSEDVYLTAEEALELGIVDEIKNLK
jgi:ATP-dependent Clp protease protease subunit